MMAKSLPEGLHPDTLAVRAAVDKSQYGENSEALYLTSSFVQPDAATAARRFAMVVLVVSLCRFQSLFHEVNVLLGGPNS